MNHELVAEINGATIFLDLDGTVVSAGKEDIDVATRQAIERLRLENRVYIVSNKQDAGRKIRISKELGIEVLATHYKKPDPRLRKPVSAFSRPYVVIGDRWLTDGLFAKIIGARFIKTQRITSKDDPLLDRLLYAIDAIVPLVRLMRPQHYIKNLLIFAPLFFVGSANDSSLLGRALLAFVAFSLMASAGYALNDVVDADTDRLHPLKSDRPIASHELTVGAGLILAGTLLTFSLAITVFVPAILPALLIYLALSVSYSLWIKRVPYVEILAFGFFYLLRVYAGGEAVGARLSPWLTLTVFSMAIFMICAKRYAEMIALRGRGVLRAYSKVFLKIALFLNIGVMTATYTFYTIYGTLKPYAHFSNPPVYFAAYRYMKHLCSGTKTEFPEKLIFQDKWLLASILIWLFSVAFIYYL